MKRFLIIPCLFFLTCIQCFSQKNSSPLFSSLSAKQTGINFSNDINEDDGLNVLAYEYFYNGGGVAIGDINSDGLADIFFTANLQKNKLYLNQGNFSFKDITRSAGVAGRKDWTTGVTMADVNGDGWLDIYVCYSGKGDEKSRRNELYINNRNLTFTESSKKYGLDDAGCSTQAIFFDYDIDGDLDCYVLNHNIKAYKNIELHFLKKDYDTLAADRLYRNDNGFFVDVSKEAGISGNPVSFGLGIAVSDINNDGWPDIYVSNDYTEQDYLYINNKNGTFSQRELYSFTHLSHFSMGSDIADINNDGLVDIFTLDMLPEDNRRQKLLQAQENYELYQDMATNGFHYQFMRNMLQLNNGNGTFSEIGQVAGISNTDWSWAPLIADFDNDGFKDIYITNGYMRDYTNKDFLKYWGDYLVKQVANRDSIRYMDLIKQMPSTEVSNYAFCNKGDLTYKNVSEEWGLKQLALSNGAAYADLDNDGDLDLIVNNINQQAFVYRNESNQLTGNHYLGIRLKSSGKNTFGLGAKLYCYTGDQKQFIEQMPTRGYQSSVSDVLYFGLGKYSIIDSLKIIWLDGSVQQLKNIDANKVITLEQKNARLVPLNRSALADKLFSFQRPLVDFTHFQIEYNDFKRQPLMPVMLSPYGPRIQVGDLNGDGREDLFIGSSQGQSSSLFLQDANGLLIKQNTPVFTADSFSVTSDILFFDANGDGFPDIYEVSGGYNDFTGNDQRLQDRLFLNDGKGNFLKADSTLPMMMGSKSVVTAADIDGDGDIDLFVGGRVKPGEYPVTPQSYLLINDGKGKFSDATDKWMKELSCIGMVSDTKWEDINADGKPDLFLVGEWMAPMIFLNTGSNLVKYDSGFESYSGWWNTFEFIDFDNDGDKDIIAGNWGLNSQMHASENEPVEIFYKDFDNNGSIDPFICCYIQGKSYPYVSRDELLDQMYSMRRKFTSYKDFAEVTIHDIFSAEELKDAGHLKVTELKTCLFENRDGKFYPREIPLQAQFSPVYKIVAEDLNKDGWTDILLLGNNEYPRLKIGKIHGNYGTVLINNKDGSFRNANFNETGLFVAGDIKDANTININGIDYLMLGINNNNLMTYKLK